ncbi:MFS transporter [Amycolatopsis benzoatilytica]|uniref:MFS transporter n=1 Tax=Amycolatopsis benzoatilytica TaxID=346045 RepID=UPI00035F13C6|nr:MFS transporter [Amycolatopsis benzoatilytica]
MTETTSARRQRLALLALCLAFFIVQLDATVVNVALDAVQHDLGGGLGGQQWVVASYTIALAAGMLTAGSLGDRFGARRICVLGTVVFGAASAVCSLAPDLPVLIAARTLQGVGAAALLPCSLALIVRQFPEPRARAHALGVWGGIAAIGLATGPVAGGVLVALADWRAIFWVNVPFAALAIVLTCRYVEESPPRCERSLDPYGLVLGTLALAAFTGGLIEAGQLGWGQSAPLIAGGIAAGTGFVVVERRRRDPMLPVEIFSSRPFSAASTAGLIFNFGLYGTLLCLSLYLQGPLGQTAFATGMLTLPLTVAIGVGATASGRLTARFGPRAPMLAGFSLAGLGAAILELADSVPLVVTGGIVLCCCSFAMPAMTSVAMSTPPEEHTALASGVLNTARQSGGALGTAVLGTLLTASGTGMSLQVPMQVVMTGYAAAVGCTLLATRGRNPVAV